MNERFPTIGDDAYQDGFLSRQWTNPIIGFLNRWDRIQVSPPTAAKFVMGKENVVLDLTPLLPNAILWLSKNGVPTRYRTVLQEIRG